MAVKKAKKEELKLEYERKNGWTLATDKEKKAIFDFALIIRLYASSRR